MDLTLEESPGAGAIGGKATPMHVAGLFDALNRRGVRYCHWKSNLRLAQGLHGRTDLDLLVDEEQRDVFRRTLEAYQVKPAAAPPGKRYPGIENYLGFDPENGRLFHLHVHYRLVLGEQFVKNYEMPLVDQFLDSARLQDGVCVPPPELELIVLSVRALLKYRDRDVVKDVLSIRSPGIPEHILQEIRWLLAQTSLHRVSQTLDELAGVVPAGIIAEFLETAVSTPRAGAKLYRLRQELRRVLGAYQRRNRFAATLRYLQELWRRRNSFLRFRPPAKMTLAPKGLSLALVGVDGSGKTTLCRELVDWLSWKLDTRLYYLGSKRPSRLSRLLYLLFRMARRSHRDFAGRFGAANVISRSLAALRQGLLYCHILSIGRDRYRRYVAGQEAARNGAVVIYDRFPLHAMLDGPKIDPAVNGTGTAVFSRLEQNLYQKFRTPDLLVILQASPEISMARKPDHQRHVIELKVQTLRKVIAEFQQGDAKTEQVLVNAEAAFEDVLRVVKQVIWQALP